MTKFLNKINTYEGIKFDSLSEKSRYLYLLGRLRLGEISHLKVHPTFLFSMDGEIVFKYIADFSYYEAEREVVEDVKSIITEKNSTFRLKKKLIEKLHKIKIDIVLY